MADTFDIRELNLRIEQQSAFISSLTMGMDRVIEIKQATLDAYNAR